MPFIRLQHLDLDGLHALVMKGFSMLSHPLIQAAHGTRIDFHQPRRSFQGTPLGQVFPNGYCSRFRDFCVPQGRVLPLTELCPAALTPQVTYLILSIGLAHRQIVLSRLPV
jgi:hypothetical protein